MVRRRGFYFVSIPDRDFSWFRHSSFANASFLVVVSIPDRDFSWFRPLPLGSVAVWVENNVSIPDRDFSWFRRKELQSILVPWCFNP